jgi:hypothetical protein
LLVLPAWDRTVASVAGNVNELKQSALGAKTSEGKLSGGRNMLCFIWLGTPDALGGRA